MDDFWPALFIAIGLVLFLEGLFYALIPARMQDMMRQLVDLPPDVLRRAGLVAAAAGVFIVWLVRG